MGLRDRLHKRWEEQGIPVPTATPIASTDLVARVERKPRAPKPLITGPTDAPVVVRESQAKARVCGYAGCTVMVTGVGRKWCAEHAAERKRERDKARSRDRVRDNPRLATPKRCDWCGKEYVRTHGSQRYCSVECSTPAKYQQKREFMARHRIETQPKTPPWPCPVCGASLRANGTQWMDGVMVRWRGCACGHRITTEERAR